MLSVDRYTSVGDKPRARGKCARRSGGTGLKISCWLLRLCAALSFSLSHALCHRALTCFAPQSHPAGRAGTLANEGFSRELVSHWKVAQAACARINLGLLERLQRSKISERTSEIKIGTHVHESAGSRVVISEKPQRRSHHGPETLMAEYLLGRVWPICDR